MAVPSGLPPPYPISANLTLKPLILRPLRCAKRFGVRCGRTALEGAGGVNAASSGSESGDSRRTPKIGSADQVTLVQEVTNQVNAYAPYPRPGRVCELPVAALLAGQGSARGLRTLPWTPSWQALRSVTRGTDSARAHFSSIFVSPILVAILVSLSTKITTTIKTTIFRDEDQDNDRDNDIQR